MRVRSIAATGTARTMMGETRTRLNHRTIARRERIMGIEEETEGKRLAPAETPTTRVKGMALPTHDRVSLNLGVRDNNVLAKSISPH